MGATTLGGTGRHRWAVLGGIDGRNCVLNVRLRCALEDIGRYCAVLGGIDGRDYVLDGITGRDYVMVGTACVSVLIGTCPL